MAADTRDALRAPEPERFVQSEGVVVRIGRDHEMIGSVSLVCHPRGLYDQTGTDPLPAMCLSGVDRLKSAAAAGDNDPAARLNVASTRVYCHEPRSAPRAKQRAQVFKPPAGEAAVCVLLKPLVAGGDL